MRLRTSSCSLLAIERTQLLQRDRAGVIGKGDAITSGGTVLHLGQEAVLVLDYRTAVDNDRLDASLGPLIGMVRFSASPPLVALIVGERTNGWARVRCDGDCGGNEQCH